MRILFVSPYLPSLIRARSYNFIKALAKRGHEIWLVCLVSERDDPSNVQHLENYCKRVETVYLGTARSLLSCLIKLPSSVALQSAYCFSKAFSAKVAETLAAQQFDVVHVEHIRAAYALPAGERAAAVFDSVDCITSLYRQFAEDKPSRLGRLIAAVEAGKLVRYEPSQAARYDRVVITSDKDKSELNALAPHLDIDVVSCGVDLEYFGQENALGEKVRIVLSGKMSYYANEAAASFFCTEILPLIMSSEPQTTLTIVGSSPSRRLRQYGRMPGVTVTGYVPDIRASLRQARVAVCPVTVGAGIQTKVIEAMAMGKPVVATTKACQALSAKDGEDLLIADEPRAFADAVVNVLRDDKLALKLGQNGRKYVENNHSWDENARLLEETYHKAIASTRDAGSRGSLG
jgi:sugar transferase (PEP-CTERM/EpsH1 system associated)